MVLIFALRFQADVKKMRFLGWQVSAWLFVCQIKIDSISQSMRAFGARGLFRSIRASA